jgi:hypothetical protein
MGIAGWGRKDKKKVDGKKSKTIEDVLVLLVSSTVRSRGIGSFLKIINGVLTIFVT